MSTDQPPSTQSSITQPSITQPSITTQQITTQWISGKTLTLITLLGFSSGLPLALSGFTLRLWLTRAHLPLAEIGLTANLGIAYSLKFLWAPALDHFRAPPPFRALGRRRSWLLITQLSLAGAILGLAFTHPAHHLAATLTLGALVAFCSASQDIMIDTWRIEFFPLPAMGTAIAGYVWGYRAAMLISGAGVIALSATIGWHAALLLMVPLQLIGAIATLLASEPPPPATNTPRSIAAQFRAAVIDPLAQFLTRPGAPLILAFIILFYLGDALAGVMLAPYYTHLGFNRAAIAIATGITPSPPSSPAPPSAASQSPASAPAAPCSPPAAFKPPPSHCIRSSASTRTSPIFC